MNTLLLRSLSSPPHAASKGATPTISPPTTLYHRLRSAGVLTSSSLSNSARRLWVGAIKRTRLFLRLIVDWLVGRRGDANGAVYGHSEIRRHGSRAGLEYSSDSIDNINRGRMNEEELRLRSAFNMRADEEEIIHEPPAASSIRGGPNSSRYVAHETASDQYCGRRISTRWCKNHNTITCCVGGS